MKQRRIVGRSKEPPKLVLKPLPKGAAAFLAKGKSCCGCKFLYGNGDGYSNYTWLDTYVDCALDHNPYLKKTNVQMPHDWKRHPDLDNLPQTMHSRCDRYDEGVWIVLDPDREDHPRNHSDDDQQIMTIINHDGHRYR